MAEPRAARHDLERLAQHPAETQALAHEGDRHDDDGAGAGQRERQEVQLEAQQGQHEGADGAETREPRAPERALDAQAPTLTTVVLGGHLDPRSRPEPAVHLEVPVAPPLVRQDEVLAGGHGLPEPVKDRLLLETVLGPEGEGERALAPRQGDGARRRVAFHRLGRGETSHPPAVSLETAKQGTEIGQQRDQEPPADAGGRRVHAGPQRGGHAASPREPERREAERGPRPAAPRHREEDQQRGGHAPLARERQMREEARGWLVKRLEEAAAEDAAVDDGPPPWDQRRAAAVDSTSPPRVEERVEAVRMPEIQQRLGLAVPPLLADVGVHGVAPEVPHHGRRAEADAVALLLQSPAEIDVVSGGAEDRIQPADLPEHLAP